MLTQLRWIGMQLDVHEQTWHFPLDAAGIADPERNAAPGPRRFQAASHQVVLAQREVMVVPGVQEDGQVWRRWRQTVEAPVR